MLLKSIFYLSVFALIFTLFAFALPDAHAATVTAVISGDWNAGATWSSGLVPADADDKIIEAGFTVTVSTLVSNSANINNQGTIDITSAGTIANPGGTITNSGSITNSGTLADTGGTITNSGSITNNLTGHINNNFGTITLNSPLSIITNNGIIANNDIITITSGTINNNLSGTILNNLGGTINNNDSITNSGTIQHIFPTATYSGSGTLTGTGIIALLGTVSADKNLSTLGYPVNITNFSVTDPDFLNINSGITLTIPSGYTLTNTGTITNSGTIINTGTFTNNGIITVSNTGSSVGIQNSGGGTLTNNSGGIITVSNTGSTIGIYNPSGTITNSGTITVSNTDGYGIYNDGTITNNSGGLITVSNSGVSSIGITNNLGTITNTGTITVSNTGISTGISNGGTITNSGTITVSNSDIQTIGISTLGTITNNSGGLITVSNTGYYGIRN